MLFNLCGFIRGRMTLPQLELLAELGFKFEAEIGELQLILPKLEAEINVKLPFLQKLEEIFDYVNNYVGNFELEMEGINGTRFFKIDANELTNMALGESIIWNNITFGKELNFDVPNIPILSGGAIGDPLPDNELAGIELEIEGMMSNDPVKINLGKSKQEIGLNKQRSALEFLLGTYNVDVSVALDGVNEALTKLVDTGTQRFNFLIARKNYLINVRIDENTNFRAEQYDFRREWLNLLVNRATGIKTIVESLKQSKNFIINAINSHANAKAFLEHFSEC